MADPYPLVLTEQYMRESEKWLAALRRGENCSVIFFPKSDRFRRLQQFLSDKERIISHLGADRKHLIQLIDFDAHTVEDQHDIEEYISNQLNFNPLSSGHHTLDEWISVFRKQSMRLIIILPHAEKYLDSEGRNSLQLYSYLLEKYSPDIISVTMFETDFTDSANQRYLPFTSTTMYQNTCYYPLYSRNDTLTFIRYLENKWNFRLPGGRAEEIEAACGGQLWLVKESVRQSMSHPEGKLLSFDTMVFRIGAIFSALTDVQKETLKKISLGNPDFQDQETEALAYFRKMNVTGEDDKLNIRILSEYIKQKGIAAVRMKIRDSAIELNNIPVDRLFSRKEQRVLKCLSARQNQIVTREELGKSIWPANTLAHYSDWAIDQIIARVRKRLSELNVPPDALKTVRGKGYMLTLS